MSKDRKPEPIPAKPKAKAEPERVCIEGVTAAEAYEKANPDMRPVEVYRETMHGPKLFFYVKD